MGAKQRARIAADCAMTVLLPLLMAYSLVGETAHEWLGIALGVLFVFHHVLNFGWYRSLLRGSYTAFRILLTSVNTLLIIVFLLLFYSGIDLSKHLLPFLPELGSASLSRVLHLTGSHWGLLLMSFHLGLHMNRFAVMLKKRKTCKAFLMALVYIAALYGCYAFVATDFLSYLLPTASFLFFDASRPLVAALADSVSVMLLFTLLGHTATRLTQHKKKKEK